MLLKLAEELKGKLRFGIMEADIDSTVDAKTMIDASEQKILIL